MGADVWTGHIKGMCCSSTPVLYTRRGGSLTGASNEENHPPTRPWGEGAAHPAAAASVWQTSEWNSQFLEFSPGTPTSKLGSIKNVQTGRRFNARTQRISNRSCQSRLAARLAVDPNEAAWVYLKIYMLDWACIAVFSAMKMVGKVQRRERRRGLKVINIQGHPIEKPPTLICGFDPEFRLLDAERLSPRASEHCCASLNAVNKVPRRPTPTASSRPARRAGDGQSSEPIKAR